VSDHELELIAEFSTGGLQIGRSVAKPDRLERVRAAIYREGKEAQPFRDCGYDYAEAFRLTYGERLDRRAATRPSRT
jgi:hypothetical protein